MNEETHVYFKVEEVSRPGGETLGKHRGVKVDFVVFLEFTSERFADPI